MSPIEAAFAVVAFALIAVVMGFLFIFPPVARRLKRRAAKRRWERSL